MNLNATTQTVEYSRNHSMNDDYILIFDASVEMEFNCVDNLRSQLTSVLRRYSVNDLCIPLIEMAVYETLLNIIDHSSSVFKEHDIRLRCYFSECTIRIVITNYGDRFDLAGIEVPDIEEHYRLGKSRGLGIFFIKKLMDGIESDYKDGINQTTLIKKIE